MSSVRSEYVTIRELHRADQLFAAIEAPPIRVNPIDTINFRIIMMQLFWGGHLDLGYELSRLTS